MERARWLSPRTRETFCSDARTLTLHNAQSRCSCNPGFARRDADEWVAVSGALEVEGDGRLPGKDCLTDERRQVDLDGAGRGAGDVGRAERGRTCDRAIVPCQRAFVPRLVRDTERCDLHRASGVEACLQLKSRRRQCAG